MKGGQRATETAQGGEVVSFTAPLPPVALRANTRTLRVVGRDGVVRRKAVHWAQRAKLVREYQEEVWCAGHEAINAYLGGVRNGVGFRMWLPSSPSASMPWERARLSLVWCHAGVAPDADNALASLKPLIDVLHTRSQRPLGIVVDDSPAHLAIMPVELRKVRHRTDERIEITIERVQEAE